MMLKDNFELKGFNKQRLLGWMRTKIILPISTCTVVMVTGGYDGKKTGCISCRSVELLNLDGTRHCSMEPLPED